MAWIGRLVLLAALGLPCGAARAAIVDFVLDGNAGEGLLGGNENPAVAGGGSGGILTAITFDTDTNTLSIDVAWGSGNGFTDLTDDATAAHIHGPTASGAPASFGENAGILYFLSGQPGYDDSATDGGFDGAIVFDPGDVDALLEGRTYINVHTAANISGEIRGTLVMVPEPSSRAAGLVALLLLALGLALRR